MKKEDFLRWKWLGRFLLPLSVFLFILPIVRSDGVAVVLSQADTSRNQAAWEVFAAPDDSFKIELPGNPLYRKTLLGGEDASEENDRSFFKCTQKVDVYYLNDDSKTGHEFFGMGVFDVSGCRRSRKLFSKEVERLFLVLGGDSKTVLKDGSLKVNGLSGRELVYKNGEPQGTILIVNGGKRIFLLFYDSANRGIAEKDRIFRSFLPKALK